METRPARALIICNGEAPSRALSRKLARDSDLVIAADGGANIARRFGIRPDFIIGDLDSITQATRNYFRTSTFVRIARQDSTDLEKALSYARQQHVKKVTLLAATGKRIDFTLGNLSVLWNFASRFELTVETDDWLAIPIVGGLKLDVTKGSTVSLIPFGLCSGITLSGLRFPLTNAVMRIGEIGVSNVAIRSTISVRVKRGKMLLIVFRRNRKA